MIQFLRRLFLAPRTIAAEMHIGDLERMRAELVIARDHIDIQIAHLDLQLDAALERRLVLAETIGTGRINA